MINQKRVKALVALGCKTSDIARKVGCSPRQVRRLIKKCGFESAECGVDISEQDIWQFMHRAGMSVSEIADTQGVSRQAVDKCLKSIVHKVESENKEICCSLEN